MRRIGDVELRLAKGSVPHYKEIKELTKSIIQVLEYEFGPEEVIKRFANPLWFNSFACLVGFEWNYSGMTTVTLKALKEVLNESDTGLIALGGKGKDAKVIEELNNIDIKDKLKEKLKESSIMSAKVDSTLVQDGYTLYFHFILADEKGNYAIINQKMNVDKGLVRRFHWLNTKDFLEDCQEGFGAKTKTLNLVGESARSSRESVLNLIQDYKPEQIKQYIIRLKTRTKSILTYFNKKEQNFTIVYQTLPYYLKIPEKIYWKAIELAQTVESFKDLLFIKGFGAGLLRSLVYVAHIIYGSEISWKDPVIYTFAHGTKAGKPYYVKRKIMLEEAEVLKNAIEEAKVGNRWKLRALKNLAKLTEDKFK